MPSAIFSPVTGMPCLPSASTKPPRAWRAASASCSFSAYMLMVMGYACMAYSLMGGRALPTAEPSGTVAVGSGVMEGSAPRLAMMERMKS